MDAFDIARRYALLGCGLAIMAVGIGLSIKADLGVSPISSLPYVLSCAFPLSVGQFTIAMHCAMILAQVVLLRRRYQLFQLWQLPIGIAFGALTDAALAFLSWVQPETYATRWALVLASCALIAAGVTATVRSRLVPLAGEGVMLAISTVTGKEFGKVKICFDTALVALSVIVSLVLMNQVVGVREGTLAAMVLVGLIVRLIARGVMAVQARRCRAKD